MDPRSNPYTPNAGVRPRAFAGRDEDLEAFDVMLDRLLRGYADQSMLITGLRGVGKTVLLGAFAEQAHMAGWVSIDAEISPEAPFGPRMAQLVRRAVLELAPRDRWLDRLRRAAGVLRSFSITVSSDGAVTGSIDVEPLEGQADSGELGEDLTDLLVALGEAAQEQETGVVFLFDEVQFLSKQEFEALIRALHKTTQRQLPISLVGAGSAAPPQAGGGSEVIRRAIVPLPNARPPVGARRDRCPHAARERARRLVRGARPSTPWWSTPTGIRTSSRSTARSCGIRAEGSPITAVEAVESQAIVEARLDESFFQVRIQRASEQETEYLRAMAELGACAAARRRCRAGPRAPLRRVGQGAHPPHREGPPVQPDVRATPPSPFLSSTGSSGGRSPFLRLGPIADPRGGAEGPTGWDRRAGPPRR